MSKTPNITFVYLSKCNIRLPGFLEDLKLEKKKQLVGQTNFRGVDRKAFSRN